MSEGSKKSLSGQTLVRIFWRLLGSSAGKGSGLTREEVADYLNLTPDYVGEHLNSLVENTNFVSRKKKKSEKKGKEEPKLPDIWGKREEKKDNSGRPAYIYYVEMDNFELSEAGRIFRDLTTDSLREYIPGSGDLSPEEKYELERAAHAVSLAVYTDMMESKWGRTAIKEKWPYDWESFKRRWGTQEERENIEDYEDVREKME